MKPFFTVMACALILTGCAGKKSLVVLMPEPDGEVGRVAVSSPQGQTVLTEAYASTEVKENQPPTTVRILSRQEAESVFKEALEATPEAPVAFILYFITGTTTLTESSQAQLNQVREETKKRLPCDISIVGHTDTVGKEETNARLSLERAQIVRDALVGIGVDPALIQVSAHGENDPLVPTADEVDEPRNRRVEVFIR